MFCPAPHLSLAQLVSFLPSADSAPPHSYGYHDAVAWIVREVYDHPARFPGIDRRRNIELWDNAWALIIAIALLALEWALRRRSGYL